MPVTELNTAESEDDPSLTGDMLEIFFDRDSDVWHATRASPSDSWDPAVIVAELSTAADETSPRVTEDGLVMAVTTNRTHALAKGKRDLFVAVRPDRQSAWSTPQPIVELNSASNDGDGHPTQDRLVMLLSSDRPGGTGESDLLLSTRTDPSAVWSAPTWLVELNTAGDEGDAWISADLRVIYFARWDGDGDIWVATRDDAQATFSAPVRASGLNTTADEVDPWLSPDLSTIYFASTRSGNKELYRASRAP